MIELKTIVDNLPIAIFLLGRDGRVLLSNRVAKKNHCVDQREGRVERFGDMVGCPNANENAAGCGFSKLCQPCRIKTMIDRAFSAKKSIAPFETNIDTRTIGVRNLTMTVTYMCASSEQEMCVVTVEDITELKKKERLEAASEAIGAICHEMNQPLQAIMGNVELLTQFQLQDGAISKIEKIFSEMKRIKNINTKLMNFTHYQTKPYLSTSILDIERSARQPSPRRKVRWIRIAAHIAEKASSFFQRTAPTSARNQNAAAAVAAARAAMSGHERHKQGEVVPINKCPSTNGQFTRYRRCAKNLILGISNRCLRFNFSHALISNKFARALLVPVHFWMDTNK